MKRAHIFVSGMVQGVFFRAFTQDNAMDLGLTGWVRNSPDGRVEAVAEGEEDKINELIKRLKQGPPSSSVSSVDVSWENTAGEFSRFEIRR